VTNRTMKRRGPATPLTRDRVLSTALAIADQGGLEALSMRRLGQELGVEAMALYYHFASRDEIVDGIVDLVFAEVELPAADGDWKTAMRGRAISLRDALLGHRWAIGLMEARGHPGPANLRHHDAVIASLRAAGLDMATVAHAYAVLDAYIYGFALTKMNLPFDATTDMAAMADGMLEAFPVGEYPNLVAFIADHATKPGYDFADEFEYGLDIVIGGLEAATVKAPAEGLESERGTPATDAEYLAPPTEPAG
jgi:AcrR family transcriptional regulator